MYVVVVEVYISFHGGALSTHLLLQCTQARAFAWQHLNHIKKGKKKTKKHELPSPLADGAVSI